MSWIDITYKDFDDTMRSRTLWLLSALFVVAMGASIYLPSILLEQSLDPQEAIVFIDGPATLHLVPITAIIIGYRSIVGERETGSIRFLLGLPHSRFDVLVGKFVGRTAVLVVPIVVGFAIAGLLAVAIYGVPPILDFAVLVGTTLLLGCAFVAIAVSVSGIVPTRIQAISVVLGLFLLFHFFWGYLINGVHYLFRGALPEDGFPAQYELLSRLNPIEAYNAILDAFLTDVGMIVVGGSQADEDVTLGEEAVSEAIYLEWWVGVLILLAWIVVPLGISYVRFQSADIQ